MPDEKDFVHLHVHTEFSLLDGLSQIKRLVKHSAESGMDALAITDHGSMFGVIDFYRAAKAQGIKPIIGMEAYMARRGMHDRESDLDSRPYHLLLLAKDQTGYKNLLKIASASQLEGYYYRPRIDHDFLAEHAEGLIATSGCLAAEIPRMVEDGREDEALRLIGWHRDVFGPENFFLELQHHNINELHALNRWLITNQDYAAVPLVATNDVHYVLDDDYDAHDTLLCIQTGNVKAEQNRLRFSSRTFHLRSPEEMWNLFADVPEALTNTRLIADMCNVSLDSEGYHLPVFPVPEGFTAETYLRHLCEAGLKWRYAARADDPDVIKRLNYELSIIHNMGFDTYFLIVWDLCEFARHADIWWNVRGSGAGSVAAYCLGITNIDPMRNGLLFERFLNPGRVSMPDIDLDYPEDRRAEMIQYCAQKYGEDKVAAIITFGTMGAKAAIRDVGRAFDMPLPEVDRIARLIPTLPGKPLKFDDVLGDDPEKALPELKEVYNTNEHARKLIDTARQLEGITRHASTHAAGVIVADKPLVEYIPLHRPTKGSAEDAPVKQVTQFPMETCESIGLLKVDFLGLSTLTIMRRACELIEQYHGVHYDLSNIPYRPDPDDPEQARMVAEMFEMIGRGETVGVFQLESQGMRRMLTDMRPSKFEHIVAGISLYRPGPLEFIPQYNKRLHGEEEVEYRHPLLEPILQETYGICVYQEQIMQIAGQLFGYELGEADLMRRAVSKKKKEALQKHRDLFVERGPEHGVDPAAANAIFDDIEFFARYGFNKSHAADYAVLTCQTAFLKCHYPHEYMAALMSVHRDDAGKVGLFAADCARMGIEILPPTVNNSELDFSIEEHGSGHAIRFGMGAIKNLGVGPIEHILEQRRAKGRFRDLEDFCQRVDTRNVNKRALESLIKVGALDEFAERPTLLAALDRIVSFSADYHKAKDTGQMSLFGDATGVDFGTVDNILGAVRDIEPVSTREMLNWEKELVGLYVTDHPLRPLAEQFAHANLTPAAELIESAESLNGQPVSVAGLVTHIRSFATKKGDMMAILTIEDITGTITAVLFPRTWGDYRELIDEDAVIVVRGKADTSRGDIQVIVDSVQQNFETVASADRAPQELERNFSWMDDDDSEGEGALLRGDDGDDGNDGANDEPAARDDYAAALPVMSPPPDEPPRGAIIDDREMPGWLEDELDNGWTPQRPIEYHDDQGYMVRKSEPNGYRDDREVKAPPAAAARARTSADAEPPREVVRPRRKPAAPEPAPEPPPGRLLTLYIQRTGDTEKDQRRLQFIHGRLKEFPGNDHFRFVLESSDKPPVVMNFPKIPIEINDEILDFVIEKLGEDNVMITEE